MPLALLLDIDGTLLDTFDLILEAQNAAIAEFGGPPLRAEELRPLIGMPLARQMEVLRGMRGPVVAAIHDAYYRRFAALVEGGVRVYPGVRDTLAHLADRPIVTMSTRRRDVADRMLEVAGLRPYFRAVVGGDDVQRPKPEPDLPQLAAGAIGASPSESLVVGDSPVDILAGRAAGMRTIAATYGYGRLQDLRDAHPDTEIERFDELAQLVRRFEAGAR